MVEQGKLTLVKESIDTFNFYVFVELLYTVAEFWQLMHTPILIILPFSRLSEKKLLLRLETKVYNWPQTGKSTVELLPVIVYVP